MSPAYASSGRVVLCLHLTLVSRLKCNSAPAVKGGVNHCIQKHGNFSFQG